MLKYPPFFTYHTKGVCVYMQLIFHPLHLKPSVAQKELRMREA